MGAVVAGPDGEDVAVEMGSYGIGVSRLAGAIIEASHDDAGIVWPESGGPVQGGASQPEDRRRRVYVAACEDIYGKLRAAGVEVLYDDRPERAGIKFADMDLIGLPWHLVVGPRGLKSGTVEVKERKSGERQEMPIETAMSQLGPS